MSINRSEQLLETFEQAPEELSEVVPDNEEKTLTPEEIEREIKILISIIGIISENLATSIELLETNYDALNEYVSAGQIVEVKADYYNYLAFFLAQARDSELKIKELLQKIDKLNSQLE